MRLPGIPSSVRVYKISTSLVPGTVVNRDSFSKVSPRLFSKVSPRLRCVFVRVLNIRGCLHAQGAVVGFNIIFIVRWGAHGLSEVTGGVEG